VVERTEQIAASNRDLAAALATVRDRERRLQDDLAQARSFQQSILPITPSPAQVEFGAIYRPLEQDVCSSDLHYRLTGRCSSWHL
jgi:serine phosphatase RsbU (regulator of sigma subunit)